MENESLGQNPQNSGKKAVLKDRSGKFIKGSAKPEGSGRQPGKKNFETEMDEAIEEFAKLNNLTPEEVKLRIYMRGAKDAMGGEYNFYRDFMDRKHGKVKDTIDLGASEDLKDFLLKLNKILDE